MEFRHITPTEITENPFKLIDKDWMLVAAANGTGESAEKIIT